MRHTGNACLSIIAQHELSNNVIKQYLKIKFPTERPVSRKARLKDFLDVEEQALHQRFLWRNSSCFLFGNYYVQQSTAQLWCSITGPRPGVILANGVTPNEHSTRNQEFKIPIPEHVRFDDTTRTMCWQDTKLFYLPNKDGQHILCVIVTFCNMKGRPEGADGTKYFFIATTSWLIAAILQIVAMAFRDNAFENENVTPEFIWQLRVPNWLPKLPIFRKKEKMNVSVLGSMERTAEEWVLDPIKPMKYSVSNNALKHISDGLGYELRKQVYLYRRWAAKEINGK